MPDENINATEVTADLVTCTLGDITFDIAAESNPLLGHGSHTVNEYTSQKVSAQTLLADGGYEAASLTVTFDQTTYNTILDYWKSGKCDLTYTVEGGGLSASYSNCTVRVSSTPQITPKANGYVTCTIEIQCLKKPEKSAE